MGEKVILEREWQVSFNRVEYIVNLTQTADIVSFEIEDDHNDRWSGDFTAQYVEEITMKAGSFKKFDIFLKMMVSAFDKDSENVYVDILTYADLEMLRNRKVAAASGESKMNTSVDSTNSKNALSKMKRYMILTYRGEFDKVHFPLPLSFEEVPNVQALKRTINRLRNKAVGGIQNEFMGERDLRQLVETLREENDDLRTRLRTMSASKKTNHAINIDMQALSESNESLKKKNKELEIVNHNHKREVDHLKKDIKTLDKNFEKIRAESVKEINKWKLRCSDLRNTKVQTQVIQPTPSATSMSGRNSSSYKEVENMRSRIIELESALRMERLINSRKSSYQGGSGTNTTSTRNRYSRSTTPPIRTRSNHNSNSAPRPSSSGYGQSSGTMMRKRSVSPNTALYGSNNTGKSPSTSRTTRHTSPSSYTNTYSSGYGQQRSNNNGARSRSRSPGGTGNYVSSSVGGRFDPTAYQKAKEAKQLAATRQGTPTWGAGRGVSTSPSLEQRLRRSHGSPGGQSGYDSSDSFNKSTSRNKTTNSKFTGRGSLDITKNSSNTKKHQTKSRSKGIADSSTTTKKLTAKEGKSSRVNKKSTTPTITNTTTGKKISYKSLATSILEGNNDLSLPAESHSQNSRHTTTSVTTNTNIGTFPIPDDVNTSKVNMSASAIDIIEEDANGKQSNEENDMDTRINALQSYLDNARKELDAKN